MPSSAVHTFTDPDAYHAAIRLVHAEGVITERGDFRAELTAVRLDRLSLQRIEESLPRIAYSAIDPNVLGVVFPTGPDQHAYVSGGRIVVGRDHRAPRGMVSCVAGGDPVETRSAYRHHAMVMRRVERALQANSEGPLYMAELCAAAGVTYPTLRICCQEHLGISPKRYLLLRRMHLARRALRRADRATTTVTEIATNYGFWELGRFSVAYRALFGESHSATLQRRPEDPKPAEIIGSPWEFYQICIAARDAAGLRSSEISGCHYGSSDHAGDRCREAARAPSSIPIATRRACARH